MTDPTPTRLEVAAMGLGVELLRLRQILAAARRSYPATDEDELFRIACETARREHQTELLKRARDGVAGGEL